MKEILADLDRWFTDREPVAVATVIQTWGSSPRRVGAKMAITAGGQISGSVSGGCVEGAVAETGLKALKTGAPQRLHFGVSDEAAWDVGLACGGALDVFVCPLDWSHFARIRPYLDAACALTLVTALGGALAGREMLVGEEDTVIGGLGDGLDAPAIAAAQHAMRAGQPQRATLAAPEPVEVFLDVIAPPPEIIAIGGVHIAIALTRLAKVLGFRTVVIDPREAFGARERFPHVDCLIPLWPDKALAQLTLTRRSAVVMLTHDPKLDDPALRMALPSPAFYVGALGSRRTQEQRRQRMLDAGIDACDVARLHGPVGIDLGGQTPEEIALAILAEIVAARHAVRPDPIAPPA
ncbi:MAG: XdhC family protein [Anaerolineae bacterium]|nr:XdhC family protein [Anaerolineae bacterium]